jgi:hypothetical protein
MADSLEENAVAIRRIQEIMDRVQQIARQTLQHSHTNATAAEGQLGELRRLVASSQTLARSAERLSALAAQFRVAEDEAEAASRAAAAEGDAAQRDGDLAATVRPPNLPAPERPSARAAEADARRRTPTAGGAARH